MAKSVLTNVYFTWNSVDISTWVRSISGFPFESETVDDTTMGTSGTRSNLGGLLNFSVDVDFAGDEASGGPAQTLFASVGAAKTVEVRLTTAARSTANPGYTSTMRLVQFNPLEGEVGTLHLQRARFVSTGTALSRATA